MAEGILTTTDFVECYRTHYPRLVRALRLSGADGPTAEDLAQEAFGRALARWRRVSRGPNPPGYVYTPPVPALATGPAPAGFPASPVGGRPPGGRRPRIRVRRPR